MRHSLFLAWLLLLLLALNACQNKGAEGMADAPPPSPRSEPVPSAQAGGTPLIGGGVSSEATFSSETRRPVLGGLVAPEDVPWYALTPQEPLAYLLSRYSHRSLLQKHGAAPALAEQWTLSGTRATFTLAEDAQWSDGTPLRPADVADLLLQAAAEGELPGVLNARARSEKQVEVELLPPLCPSLTRVATWPIVDVREWPPVRSSSALAVKAVGTSEWVLGAERLRYRRYPDELALRAAWAEGEINAVLGGNTLSLGALAGPAEAAQPPGPLLATLLFRMEDPLLRSRVLREALTLATDRAALFADSYGIEPAALLTALLPDGHWAAPTAPLPTDTERAATLLTEAGWRDRDGDGVRESATGQPLRLLLTLPLSDDQRWERLAKSLAAQWAAVGVDLQPRYLESYSFQERLHAEQWEIALVAYRVAPDPDQRALWSAPASDDLLGNDLNITGYHNPAVAELLTQGAQVPGCQPKDRAPFYQEAWRQLLQDRPLWPLFPLPLDVVQRPDVIWP